MTAGNPLAMLGGGNRIALRGLGRVVRWLTVAIACLAATAAPALASSSCAAVNAGAFNLNATLSASSSSILTAWDVGDQITLTLSNPVFGSSIDGFYHGPTFASGTFGSLSTTNVPLTGSVNLSHTVTGTDITNGIAVDPENNDYVTATCTPVAPAVTGISPSSGPVAGGTQVTITGTSFLGATAVKFGATAATSFTVNGDTSITATSPAGTGTVDVTVTNSGGTSTTGAADQFTYQPPPSVTGVSPNSGPTAGGTVVSITGQNFTGATAVKFGASSATAFTVNSATSITATSPAGSSGTVDVTVTTPNGTSGPGSADHFTYVARPTVTSVSPASGSTAGGTTVTITGTNFTNITTVKFGAGTASFAVNSGSSITATSPPASSGDVNVTVTNGGGTSATSAADLFSYYPAVTSVWVSPSTGTNTGSCPQTAPCQTLHYALQQASPGTVVNILSGGTFGPITITQPVIINGPDDGSASIVWSATQPGCVGGSAGSCDGNAAANYAVEIAADPTEGIVELNNLTIDNGAGTNGALHVSSAFSVSMTGSVLRGGTGAASQIMLVDSSQGSTLELFFSNCDIGFSSTGGGILMAPTSATPVTALFQGGEVHSGLFGVKFDASGLSAGSEIQAGIDKSRFFSFTNSAVTAKAAGNGGVTAVLSRSTIVNTGSSAFNVNGANAAGLLFKDTITGNQVGVAVGAGATAYSFGNNEIFGNSTNVTGNLTGSAVQ